jgi:hypothetical protein
MCGNDIDRHEVLSGKVSVPESARPLIHELPAYVQGAKAGS